MVMMKMITMGYERGRITGRLPGQRRDTTPTRRGQNNQEGKNRDEGMTPPSLLSLTLSKA